MHWKPGSWILIGVLLATLTTAGTAQLATTHIADTIYHADGSAATGSAIISWPAFTTSGGTSIPSGNTSTLIASSGALNVDLVPNAGSTPMGSYYTVVYHLDDGSTTRQYWVVPQSSATVKVSAIESSVLPVSVAMQTASRNYVDTAIAAAVTGHPLDSTPYVLKTGDTLSGPLLLPGDPVSAMQASNKHYVDASVAALASGLDQSGSVPQATQNTVPAYIVSPSGGMASQGPTHVTIDPTGYNLSGFHSAWTSLGVNSAPGDCNLPGPTYINGSCMYQSTVDLGTTALSGHNTRFDSYGPGGNPTVNAGEGPSTVVMSDDGYMANAAVRNIWQSTTAAFGVGDFVGMNWFHTGNAGVAFPSDEGVELVKNDGGQQEYWGGTTRGYFSASVAAGGAGTQTPTFSEVHGCTNLFQKCLPSAGTPMLDISQGGDTGFFTGKSVVFSAAPLGWLAQLPTTGGLTTATAWGYQIGAKIAPNTITDTPVAQTLTLQGGAGTFTSGLACVIGSNYEEQSIITSVSGSAPTQTLQLPLAYPNKDVAIFQGPCKFISFNGDLALGTRTAYPGVSIDGINLIYSVPNYGWMGGIELPIPGSEPETTAGAGDPNSGFATYCGARVTKLTGLNPLATSLEQNGCRWTANDAVEDPDFPIQNVIGYTSRVNMNNPSGPNAGLLGAKVSISGMGASGLAAALELNNLFADTNCAPYNMGGCGGRLTPPNMIESNPQMPGGFWNDDLMAHYAPKNSVIEFQDHVPGQTGYNLFRDPNWGSIAIDSSNTFTVTGNIRTPNAIHAGGGAIDSTLSVGGLLSGTEISLNDQAAGPAQIKLNTVQGAPGAQFGGIPFYYNLHDNSAHYFGGLMPYTDAAAPNDPGIALEAGGAIALWAAPGTFTGNHEANLSLMNGRNDCPTLLCLGPGAQLTPAGELTVNGGVKVGTGATGADANLFVNGSHLWLIQGSHFANQLAFGDLTSGLYSWLQQVNVGGGGAGFIQTNSLNVNCWANGVVNPGVSACDTGLSRDAAGVVDVGNGAQGDKSGTMNAATLSANLYKGPETAPTGACSVVGWAFSQDGHISFCDGSTWVTKI